MKISVVIPVFNEEKSISLCLESLLKQSFTNLEVIVVDDGSQDRTASIVNHYLVKLLKQNHLGAGAARNLGARYAKGEILVFVDADMVFERSFIEKLTSPVIKEEAIGTFSKEELVLNKNNNWSKCWNINKKLPLDRMHSENYPDHQPVFRAILKKKFEEAGGFSSIGYIDDYTLAEKLGVQAVAAPGAVFYHRNPENLREVWQQARWIGKSEYKRRKVKQELLMKIISLIRYSLPFSITSGLIKSLSYRVPHFLVFKVVYDFAVEISLLRSFFNEQRYK